MQNYKFLLTLQKKLKKNDTLIVGAAEFEVGISALLYVRTVYNCLQPREYLAQTRRVENLLVSIACIEPYRIAGFLNGTGQKGRGLGIVEWISAGQGDVEVLFLNDIENLVESHQSSGLRVVALRVMATRTTMRASGEINRGTETGAVYSGAPDNI